jgi:hypothetical protein
VDIEREKEAQDEKTSGRGVNKEVEESRREEEK